MPDYNEFLTRIFEILKPFAKQGIILNEDSELVTELGLDLPAGDGVNRAD